MDRFEGARGFIFDCDGTLLDTLDAWDKAEADLFAQAGPLTQEQADEIHAAPIERAAELFHNRYGVGESAQAVLTHLDGHLLPYYRDEARAMPGACEFVRAVAARGVPCVVVSSSPRRYLDAGLRRVGIRECFLDLVTTDEVGASKQEPQIYERALQVLGSPKGATWAVDDAPYAVAYMSAFGLRTVGVGAGDSKERADKLRAVSDVFVQSLSDIVI